MRRTIPCLLLATVMTALAGACAGAATPRVVEIGSAPDAAASAAAAAVVEPVPSAPDAGAPAPAVTDAAAPPQVSEQPDPCRGAAFDLDALPGACAAELSERAAPGLAASLALDAPSVKGGTDVGVTLKLTNTTRAPLELVLRPGCEFLELQAFSGKKRADWVNDKCGFGRGCGGGPRRIVLEPGGALTKKLVYTANRIAFDGNCHEVKTPLPAGRYELRLDASSSSPIRSLVGKVTAPLVVTR